MFTFGRVVSLIIIATCLGITVFVVHDRYRAFAFPCEAPLAYRLGDIDERFNLSRADALRAVREAEEIWEDGVGQDVFVYSDTAPLVIDFVFDERQADTLEAMRLEKELDAGKAQYDDLTGDLSSVESQYEREKAIYENLLRTHQKNVDDYNEDVDKWNDRGGAPEDVVKKLNKEQKELREEFARVEAQRKKVNALVGNSRQLVNDINAVAADVNSDVATFNDLYGEGRAFEQGLFNSAEGITIYQFRAHEDLRLVLAHELGHARGIDHVDDGTALMHPIMAEQNIASPSLTAADRSAFAAVCDPKTFWEFVESAIRNSHSTR